MPRLVRPSSTKSGHEDDPREWITWDQATAKLKAEEVYWVSTSGKDCRPHSVPVIGIWKDDSFFFETEADSVKGRNLRSNPAIVVHVQNGDDTVIVNGAALREEGRESLGLLRDDYISKYEYTPDWSEKSGQVVYKVTPKVVHAWRNPHRRRNQVKFLF